MIPQPKNVAPSVVEGIMAQIVEAVAWSASKACDAIQRGTRCYLKPNRHGNNSDKAGAAVKQAIHVNCSETNIGWLFGPNPLL